MAAILQISTCFLLLLWPHSTETCGPGEQCEKDFYLASLNGELDNVNKALTSGSINIDMRNDEHLTPLMAAAQSGHLDVVQALITHGANIKETRSSTGATALHLATCTNQAEVAEELLGEGADVNAMNLAGYTPLMLAAQKGHLNVVHALHKANAKLDLKHPSIGSTALFQAAELNQTVIVRKLLSAGAKSNVINNEGHTPLMKAIKEGYYNVVQVLLLDSDKHVIDVDLASTKHKWTALHFAASYNHPDIAQLLLKKGADKTKETKSGNTPAALAGLHGSIVTKRIIENYDKNK